MTFEVANDIIELVYIRNYLSFITIDNIYYWGNQSWLSSQNLTTKFWANRACGVVAAANVACYISEEFNIKELYPYKTKNRADYSMHIYDIYRYMNPAFYGVPTIGRMVKGYVDFSRSRGLDVKPVYLNLSWTLPNIVDYIKEGLGSNTPVMLLTWNSKVKNLKNHWVTITGYYKTKDNKNYVITSNWGKMEIFDLDQWFQGFSIYKGVIYFKF